MVNDEVMRLRKERRIIRIEHDAGARVGIVADTHSAPHEAGFKHLASLAPDVLLHAGDIGDVRVLETLDTIAPVHAVRGNIDSRVAEFPDVLVLRIECAGVHAVTVLLTHIAVSGVSIRREVSRWAKEENASLVICGHSHVPLVLQQQGLTLFNPGSIGPRRFRLPIVFGIMDITAKAIDLRHVDCETGRMWQP